MTAAYLHLLINCLPLFGALFGITSLIWGLLKHNTGLKTAGLIFLLAAAFGGWIAHISDEQGGTFFTPKFMVARSPKNR